eukprot:scaffold17881_cov148-Skeletonema_dohrnii-CCMP3373.AAC.8
MADETEQQLREKIAAQKGLIANLPSLRSIVDETGLTSPETKARAQLIKELSDNEDRLELLIESKRVADVVRLQDELHPPLDSEDCPICLETVKHVNSKTTIRFYCCGGFTCTKCSDERMAKYTAEGFDEMYRGKCPLCREKMPIEGDYKEIGSMLLKHANKGKAWAQMHVGNKYFNGRNGYDLDRERGLKLIEESADQRDPDGLLHLALALAYSGETLERDESKYVHYLKEAADLGHPDAQLQLALTYERQDNEKMLLHYITLAASRGDSTACCLLGGYFTNADCGLPKSLILAKHYSEKSLEVDSFEPDDKPVSAYNFSLASLHLGLERYEGVLNIPGHSPIPTILFWARKAQEGESLPIIGGATKLISIIEAKEKSRCTNCRKEAEGSSFKRCVRCLGAWYCGKECQVQHWKAGHKVDCIKRK